MNYPRLCDMVQLGSRLLSPSSMPSGPFWKPLMLAQNDRQVPELVVVKAWPPGF